MHPNARVDDVLSRPAHARAAIHTYTRTLFTPQDTHNSDTHTDRRKNISYVP